MYINNKLVESLEIDKKKIVLPGYLRNLVRGLKEKHNSHIGVGAEPEFLIQNICCITTPYDDRIDSRRSENHSYKRLSLHENAG